MANFIILDELLRIFSETLNETAALLFEIVLLPTNFLLNN